jgi:hypothetical protein
MPPVARSEGRRSRKLVFWNACPARARLVEPAESSVPDFAHRGPTKETHDGRWIERTDSPSGWLGRSPTARHVVVCDARVDVAHGGGTTQASACRAAAVAMLGGVE